MDVRFRVVSGDFRLNGSDLLSELVDSEVGDSDEEMPPQVLRSVTQELHSSLELEEQPPLVGRAHTTEF